MRHRKGNAKVFPLVRPARGPAERWSDLALLIPVALLALVGCSVTPREEARQRIDVDGFRRLAREATCSESANRLYVIDDRYVFWRREGNCPDNAFAHTLFGRSPEDILCRTGDSIAGPMTSCVKGAPRALFDTVRANMDREDLGLSPDRVRQLDL